MAKKRAQYINIVFIHVAFVALCHDNMYDRPEKKDQCLKPMYTACLSFL